MLGLAIYENIDKEGDVLMFYSIVDVTPLSHPVSISHVLSVTVGLLQVL